MKQTTVIATVDTLSGPYTPMVLTMDRDDIGIGIVDDPVEGPVLQLDADDYAVTVHGSGFKGRIRETTSDGYIIDGEDVIPAQLNLRTLDRCHTSRIAVEAAADTGKQRAVIIIQQLDA